jgi:hypothetical protein
MSCGKPFTNISFSEASEIPMSPLHENNLSFQRRLHPSFTVFAVAAFVSIGLAGCAYQPTKEDMAVYHEVNRQTTKYLELASSVPRAKVSNDDKNRTKLVTVYLSETPDSFKIEDIENRSSPKRDIDPNWKCVRLGYLYPQGWNGTFGELLEYCLAPGMRPKAVHERMRIDEYNRYKLSILNKLFQKYREDTQGVLPLLQSDITIGPGMRIVRTYPGHDFTGVLKEALSATIASGQMVAANQIYDELHARKALAPAERTRYAEIESGRVARELESRRQTPSYQALLKETTPCRVATVPNPRPQPDETTEFYGTCTGGDAPKAVTGIVIWKVRNRAVDISCLSNSAYTSVTRTDAFDACGRFWELVPNYCNIANYHGQCSAGVPNGVGIQTGGGAALFGNGTMYINRGMFSNGKLHGYGFHASVGGCGMAGCSGNPNFQTGWFNDGEIKFSCQPFTECASNVSGRDYQKTLSNPGSSASSADVERLRKEGSFESLLTAFTASGNIADLKAAESLARTPAQKADLEYTLMRLAGYAKALSLTATARSGQQVASLSESDHLLGFVRGVKSDVPVKVEWALSQDKKRMALQHGQYKVKVTVGLDVEKQITTCLGICSTRTETDRYRKTFYPTLNRSNGFAERGNFDLAVGANRAGSALGVQRAEVLSSVKPVMAIESVELSK